ncbi:small nuclear ribonucleoprotein sm D1, putative [Entamoeba invadens IP1]|uniref:Small nuclear ribonucleoprotein Sm D1 n=1 Tax=Entamoeba invadens IP1 TaxID=370355 RepID=A0A0A1UDK4_ENTIV|nr:small nuclear ribonucleoprotein sm D1, putative [Entamoeba invadens IP1]ELP94416.1 small nuclear ribonucleoprotein sm D1, putative [Entamoeba invadens IP1]|eukprot:XP_004261187.1 small nuclear ribonucleoprotein sm D1, putative [Entamoeba invadens IP1]
MKLTRFLMRLTNEVLTIELKDGSIVTGTVVGVDNYMNIHLKVVQLTPKGKNPITLDQSTIRGNNIRNIILPETLNLDTYLIDDTPRMKVKAVVKSQIKRKAAATKPKAPQK